MKKSLTISAVALLSLVLATGCSNNNSASSDTSAAKNSKVQKSSKQESKSTSKSSTSSQSRSQSQAPEASRLAQMNRRLRSVFPSMPLPQNDGLGQGSKTLNIRYTQEGNTNTIYYSVGRNAKNFNAANVKSELPYATLSDSQGLTSDQISQRINYQNIESGLPTVDLGNNVTATEQAGAGQRYVTWHKDMWSITVHGNSVNNLDPVPNSKNLVSLLKRYNLPKTSNNASVVVNMGDSYGSLNTIITWEQNGHLYQMKAHSTETALAMLASLK